MTRFDDNRPLISICIPTFNRAGCLDNLFRNLEAVKRTFGDQVEICVSNNQSTDSTAQVIEAWQDRLSLQVVTQKKNIGATMNCIEITRLAGGKWTLIIGDDDEIIFQNFKQLIELLQTANDRDWILLGVVRGDKGNLLGDLKIGKYAAKSFRRIVLRTGIFRFGFIGMHVFPSALRPQFLSFVTQEGLSWPHIALFLRHLESGEVRILRDPVVFQSKGGSELFWYSGDWVRVNLRKFDIFRSTSIKVDGLRWFCYGLTLRDLYSPKLMMLLAKWRVLEPSDFYQKAFGEYISRYRILGPYLLLATVHYMFLLGLMFTPHIVFRSLLRLIGQDTITKYNLKKQTMSRFDGEKRGA